MKMSSSRLNDNRSRNWRTAPIFCCKCAATPKIHPSKEFMLLNCSHILCKDCCRSSNAGDDKVWCHVERVHQKCMPINSQLSPRLFSILFADSHERLQEAFQHYQSSMKRYNVLANLVFDNNPIPSEAELIAAKKRLQELTDANLRHPKKEAQQKLKDDMQKMRLGLGKIVQVYRKQEAEEKVFVTPPQQRCPVETQNFKFTDINKSSQNLGIRSILKKRIGEDPAIERNSDASYRSRSSVSTNNNERSDHTSSRHYAADIHNRYLYRETTSRPISHMADAEQLRNSIRPTSSTRTNSSMVHNSSARPSTSHREVGFPRPLDFLFPPLPIPDMRNCHISAPQKNPMFSRSNSSGYNSFQNSSSGSHRFQ